MNRTLKFITIAAGVATVWAMATAQSSPQAHRGTAETTLIGISLYDTGMKVVTRYGNPDEIQPLTLGAGAAGGAPASGGGRGGPGPAGAPAGGGGAGGAAQGAMVIGDPFDTGRFNQLGIAPGDEPAARGGGGGGGTTMGKGPGGGGPGPSGGGGAMGGATQGSGSLVQYTRWVYNRNNSRYAFVLDKFNRVVQIEAVGLYDGKVQTKRGAAFGSTFQSIIKKYNAPDGYEISGDTIVMRYLTRDRVAFKLQRVKAGKPQVVTGIVVAAGK